MSLIPITDFTLVVFIPTVLILMRAHGITTRINCYFVVEGVVVEGVERDPTIPIVIGGKLSLGFVPLSSFPFSYSSYSVSLNYT